MTYNDDGNPHNYIFVVDDSEDLTEGLIVCVAPTDYFNKENCLSDWELNWKCPPWMEEAQESMYIIDASAPGALTSVQDVHNYLISIGMGYDPAFANFLGRPIVGPAVVPSVPVKTKKLSTAFFKDYIQNVMVSDKNYRHIFEAYAGQPAETSSLKSSKGWKRLFKKKGSIKSLADYDCSIGYSQVTIVLNEHCSGQMEFDEVFDLDYISNFENTIVVREYCWTGNSDEDTTITFITNADDTEIVAICTHID